MGVTASVTDGVIQAQATTSTREVKNGSTMGKDDFLQLLVAQMKFQDPLEPTSNTEYVAQYAQFSEVEQMQNMSQNMDLSRASSLVGKTVEITKTSDSGQETTVMGKVDYVKYEAGKALLGIGDELYSLEDVTHVCDEDYLNATDIANALLSELKKLPQLDKLTLSDKDRVENISKVYDAMNTYQKSFLSETDKKSIEQYAEKMRQMVNEAQESADNDNNSDTTTEGEA
ncbi:MAG: flagellar hook capping protein [Lachnospiraceae bacterium]|nr:flagellar hook capping protein [Lachnospiraceae bacterium]